MLDTKFQGLFTSADASALTEAASRFTLYKVGTTTAITVAATDMVVIRAIMVSMAGATARTIQVYDGADATVDAGEAGYEATLAQNAVHESNLGFTCQDGTYPKVKASGAGQLTALIRGFVRSY